MSIKIQFLTQCLEIIDVFESDALKRLRRFYVAGFNLSKINLS